MIAEITCLHSTPWCTSFWIEKRITFYLNIDPMKWIHRADLPRSKQVLFVRFLMPLLIDFISQQCQVSFVLFLKNYCSQKIVFHMTKAEKVEYVINELERLYPKTPVPLDHKDPFTLLVAVVLSAQCTDERVNKITPKLFSVADNPYDMAQLTVEEIAAIIRPWDSFL